jgi:NADH-quinone oxidoreductase subunit B
VTRATLLTIGRAAPDPAPVRLELDWGRGRTVWAFEIGLACCAVEFAAAAVGRQEILRPVAREPDGVDRAAGDGDASIVVVSGTVTDKLAPAIKDFYDALPGPKYVISFGSCANCGGPYWDSYCVTKGIDQILPVDVYVPGCPPRPEALIDGIATLRAQIEAAG